MEYLAQVHRPAGSVDADVATGVVDAGYGGYRTPARNFHSGTYMPGERASREATLWEIRLEESAAIGSAAVRSSVRPAYANTTSSTTGIVT